MRRMLERPAVLEALVHVGLGLFAALVFLPMLGRDGLWDPWETHYAEVARRIVVDNDWIVLRWHDENFYSKPVFLFWVVALSMKTLGVGNLAVRLPSALFGIAGVVLTYTYTSRLHGRIQGIVAAAALTTMPLYVFIARQNMTDMPFMVAMTVGTLGVAYRFHSPDGGSWRGLVAILASFACFGIATLSKGLLGFALPGAATLVYFIVSGRWRLIRRLSLHLGIPVFLLVTLPWYVGMSIQQGHEFLYEFFYLHHLARAGGGVHGERGTFDYFVNQVGYAVLPWIVLVPAAIGHLVRRIIDERDEEERQRVLFLVIWTVSTFALFTIARTKFHHYIFPLLPPLAVVLGTWIVDAVRRGVPRWERALLLMGAAFAILVAIDLAADSNRFTRLFTYAYERPLPHVTGIPLAVWVTVGVSVTGAALIALAPAARLRLSGAALTGLGALALSFVLVHHMMPRIALDIGQAECFSLWHGRDAQPGDRFYNWKMNWRGEIYQSRDTIPKVSRLDQLRGLLKDPGRLYIITTAERFRQLDLEVERLRGRPLEQLNRYQYRYVMSLWDEPVLEPRPQRPHVDALPPGSVPVHATLGEGMLELVGYRVEERRVELGGAFFVTLYWKALRKVDAHYLVFIHGETPSLGEMQRFTGNHVTGEGFYPPEQWKPGALVEDTFSVCVDYGIPRGRYRLYAGLYKDKDRLEVDDAALHDGHDRVAMGKVVVY